MTSVTLAIGQLDSISFLHAATPVLAPTMLNAPSGHNLQLLCVQQLGTGPFCKNYAKLYFDTKHFQLLSVNGMSILLMVCPFNPGHWQYC